MFGNFHLEMGGSIARIASLTLAWAISTTSLCVPAAFAKDSGVLEDRSRIKILYSEDNALCEPLARLYANLGREYPRAHNWEDRYEKKFYSIGFHPIKPLQGPFYYYQKWLLNGYFRIHTASGKQSRLIHVEDIDTTPHGFLTDLWVFKEDADIRQADFFTLEGGGPGKNFDPADIDIAILFTIPFSTFNITGYRRIELPYYFLKIASEADKLAIRNSAGRWFVPFPGFTEVSNSIVQRPFNVGSRTIILAENRESFLAYQITDSGKIDDVCYLITTSALRGLHEMGWKPTGAKQ